jgi:macrolide transport system ATP-binding/permease protein
MDGPVRYGGNYSAYLAEKRAEQERWERRWAEEQEELAALRVSAGITAHRVAPDRGLRDNEKMGYGHRANRVQDQISRRVRNAARRLETLERSRVGEPPKPLRFESTALAAPTVRHDCRGARHRDARVSHLPLPAVPGRASRVTRIL